MSELTEKERRQKDRYYQRTYGISLTRYEEMKAESKGGCWICGKKPKEGGKSLAVDHDHSYKKVGVGTGKLGDHQWSASAFYNNFRYTGFGGSKGEAISVVREQLKTASVRGLLCWKCNSGLKKFDDKPLYLANAAVYLKKHQNGNISAMCVNQ